MAFIGGSTIAQMQFSLRGTVRLHPDDLKGYGSIIQEIYLDELQTKNRPVLTVLAQNGIPILISDDSKVVENDREEKLPNDIVQVLVCV